VLGFAQWLALRRVGIDARWILATGGGLAVGLGFAFAIFGYGHTVSDMWIVGAVSGLGIGIAQWPLLHGLVKGSVAWIPATAAAWALGWTVTTAIGVDPDRPLGCLRSLRLRDVHSAIGSGPVGPRPIRSERPMTS